MTFIIVGATFIVFWDVLKKIDAVSTSFTPTSDTMSSLLSDLNLILPISTFAILLGVACAFYLQEWLPVTNWIRCFIESKVALLTSLPSLLYGLLAIVILFRYSGSLKDVETSLAVQNVKEPGLEVIPFQRNTTLFYIEALIFVLLVMPIAIQTTQKALQSVATSVRESAYALGATQWQVLKRQVIPLAFPGILAGSCAAMSRAFAAAALLIGVHIIGYTTAPRGIPDRLMLFFGVALLLSTVSCFLTEMSTPASTQHN